MCGGGPAMDHHETAPSPSARSLIGSPNRRGNLLATPTKSSPIGSSSRSSSAQKKATPSSPSKPTMMVAPQRPDLSSPLPSTSSAVVSNSPKKATSTRAVRTNLTSVALSPQSPPTSSCCIPSTTSQTTPTRPRTNALPTLSSSSSTNGHSSPSVSLPALSTSSSSTPTKKNYPSPTKRGQKCNVDGDPRSTSAPAASSLPAPTIFSDGITPMPKRKDAHMHPPHTPTGTVSVLTFYPTKEEFADFNGYIQKIEAAGAHLSCGICKIVPPEGWTPRPDGYDFDLIDSFVINNPVKERVDMERGAGMYFKSNTVYRKSMTVKEYRKMAESKDYSSRHPEYKGTQLEHDLFRNLTFGEPIYGADTLGSIQKKTVKEFNMRELGTILDETKEDGKVIHGVNTVYMYYGMYRTTFPWHCEDMDLYSINYVHFGAPKYWFAIPPESASRFDCVMSQIFAQESCKTFLRHKNHIVTPTVLRNNGIPYGTMVQMPGEFIITFPRGYHMGFNLGYNCAESTNFATDRWIDFGKNALLCKCRPDMVEIDMNPFMKRYRPSEYDNWHSYWYEPRPTVIAATPKGKRRGGLASAESPATKKRKASTGQSASSGSKAARPLLDSGALALRKKQNFRKEMGDLFSSSPVNLFAERQRNSLAALSSPHCDVCSLFLPNHLRKRTDSIPNRSRRLISSRLFSKEQPSTSYQSSTPSDPTEDILLTCTNCLITVHPSCYGGDDGQASSSTQQWKCLRCRARPDISIRSTFCSLCQLRGGALLPCQAGLDPAFVHVTCAILNRRTSFNRSLGPSLCYTHPAPKHAPLTSVLSRLSAPYVIEMGDEHEKSLRQCEVCGMSREGLVRCSACPDDSLDAVFAHVSCAKLSGYLFERRHFPQCAAMICDRHDAEWTEEDVSHLPPLPVPCDVTLWLDGGRRVVPARAESFDSNRLLVVQFEDGSLSTNTLPGDVTSCTCISCDGVDHQMGAVLRVRWDDGLEYEGFSRGSVEVASATVRIGDSAPTRTAVPLTPNSALAACTLSSQPTLSPPEQQEEVLVVSRAEIYGPDEILPKEVRRKLQKLSQ